MAIVVLDRDGVINQDSADYIKSADEWIPLEGSIEAIALLCNKGYRVYIATNQAGLARQLFTPSDLESMHHKLCRLVDQAGGQISGIFFCPHHPDEDCACRKPKPGLLEQIQSAAGVSLQDEPFVGDSIKDLEAAIAFGAKPVLVRTGNGLKTESQLGRLNETTISVFDDLMSFAERQQSV